MKGVITHEITCNGDEFVFKNRLLELKIFDDDDTVHFYPGEWRYGCKMQLDDLKEFIEKYEEWKEETTEGEK